MNAKTGQLKSIPLTLAAFIIIIAGMKLAESWFNPLLMAFFISIICAQPIRWLKKKKIPDGLAILIVILGIIAIYIGFIELIGKSLTLFLGDTAQHQTKFREVMNSFSEVLNKKGIDIELLGGSGVLDPSKIMEYTSKLLGRLREMMSKEITFIILTIFLLTEVKSIALKVKVLAKSTHVTNDYLQSIGNSLRHYLSIKTLTSFITGVLVCVSLTFIGVDYPVLWGLVAFLLNFIPTIGSFIAAIPAVIYSIIQLGFPASYFTIGAYILINIGIGNVLEPKIMGKGMGLSTFIVFFGLIFWGFVLGPVGMFLSVPIMITIKLVLEQNDDNKWIAAMLGTKSDAEALLNLNKTTSKSGRREKE